MKLRDLDPHFVQDIDSVRTRRVDSLDAAQGLDFQCPACAVGKDCGRREDGCGFVIGCHYIRVWFANPRKLPPVPADREPLPGRWTIVSGTGFDDLTLTASIFLPTAPCKWHGYITAGGIVTC